jgi:hypothetical protein
LPDTEFQTLSPETAPEASALTNSPTLEQVNSPGAKGILNRTPQTAQVPLGTTANGVVSVPLLWDEGSGKQLGDKFAVTLTDNVTATDGFIAFPAGTVVIAFASTVSLTNRMVQATAVALVYSDRNGQIKQQPIPEGAILIAGEGGRPLIASGYFDPGSILPDRISSPQCCRELDESVKCSQSLKSGALAVLAVGLGAVQPPLKVETPKFGQPSSMASSAP